MEYLSDLEKIFNRIRSELEDELSAIRTNRPTPKLIENIEAVYMEQSMSIKQLGSITVEPPRNLVVTPWDKEMMASISKAIEDAKLGFTSAVQGSVVRITLPQLTEERREELGRIVKNIAEQSSIEQITLSITHTANFAIASVVALREV